MDIHNVISYPLSSEKTESLKAASNIYSFKVNFKADKRKIKNAVEKFFNVEVDSVRTVIVRGKKVTRFGKTIGKKPNWKKAYVRLAAGQSIDLMTRA